MVLRIIINPYAKRWRIHVTLSPSTGIALRFSTRLDQLSLFLWRGDLFS
jgi:hypothetical protein